MFSIRLVSILLVSSAAAVGQQYVISTVVGGTPPSTPATAVNVSSGYPSSVATDAFGNLYFASSLNCVFKVDVNGVLTRVAGNSRSGYSGDGGAATDAQLNAPTALAVDRDGNLYIADRYRIRKVAKSGVITTVAGNGTKGFSGDGGPATDAQLSIPSGLAV